MYYASALSYQQDKDSGSNKKPIESEEPRSLARCLKSFIITRVSYLAPFYPMGPSSF
jgi:hypothetical protein